MHTIQHSIIESYSAKQMYALINDVNAYKDFIPGCVNSGIKNQTDSEMVAFMEIEKLGIKKSFTTRNRLVQDAVIEMHLVDGPFKQLEGKWTFTPLSDTTCKIAFDIEFEFKNKLIELAFCPIFKEIISNLINVFSQRAKHIYRTA